MIKPGNMPANAHPPQLNLIWQISSIILSARILPAYHQQRGCRARIGTGAYGKTRWSLFNDERLYGYQRRCRGGKNQIKKGGNIA
jgi:hypothetical protein